MSLELDVVRDVSDKLTRANIPFMLTGSMAMNAYAQPRMTRDIDVVIAVQPGQITQFVDAFAASYYLDVESVADALRHESLFNAIHQEWLFKVDFIIRKSSPYRRIEFDRRQRIEIEGSETWIASKEDLILSKLCWGNDSRAEYQARDIRNLLQTGYDHAYVMHWAAELNVLNYLAEIEP